MAFYDDDDPYSHDKGGRLTNTYIRYNGGKFILYEGSLDDTSMCIKKNASHKHEITQLKEFVEKWEQIKNIKNDIHKIKIPKLSQLKDKQTVASKKFEFSDSESDADDYLYDLINDSDDEEDTEEAVKNLTPEERK